MARRRRFPLVLAVCLAFFVLLSVVLSRRVPTSSARIPGAAPTEVTTTTTSSLALKTAHRRVDEATPTVPPSSSLALKTAHRRVDEATPTVPPSTSPAPPLLNISVTLFSYDRHNAVSISVASFAKMLKRTVRSVRHVTLADIDQHPMQDGSEADLDVFHVNLNQVRNIRVTLLPHKLLRLAPQRVIVPYWETETIPWVWRPRGLKFRFDEVWAPSPFLQQVLEPFFGACPFVSPHVSPSFDLPAILPTSQEERFTFLFAFDPLSGVERKNPEAFARACGHFDASAVHCIIHSSRNASASRNRDLKPLRELARQHASVVTLHEGRLPREKVAALFARADAYVSPHRAEGFGLTLVEALMLGKPLICTNYGGMTPLLQNGTTAFVLPFERIATPRGSFYKGEWADPVGLYDMMKHVLQNREQAKKVGLQGQRWAQKTFSFDASRNRLENVIVKLFGKRKG